MKPGFFRLLIACFGVISVIPQSLHSQIPSPGDRDAAGRVYAKIIVTITGESGSFGHPAGDLRFLVVSESGDRVSVRTNDAGVASTWVAAGSYRIVNPDPYTWDGNTYTWDVVVNIRGGTGIIKLSQSNATRVAALNSPIPQSQSVGFGTTPPATSLIAVQRSISEGFFFAPHFLGASLQTEDEPVESGGGFGLTFGYGPARAVAFFLTIDAATIDIEDPDIEGTYTLAQADLGVRLNFRDKFEKGIPYVQAAYTARVAQSSVSGSDIQISGPAFTAGIGLNYYFQPKLAFDLGLSYSYGRFNTLKIDDEEFDTDGLESHGVRFQIGLTWFPFSSVNR